MVELVKVTKHDTYVDAILPNVRLVMNPLDKKGNEFVVIIQGKQTKEIHNGKEFVNLGLTWLPANEAAAKFGKDVIANMVALLAEITDAVCDKCGKVFAIKALVKHDGGKKCKACADRDIAWHADWKAKCNAAKAAKGEPQVDDNDVLTPWAGKLVATPL